MKEIPTSPSSVLMDKRAYERAARGALHQWKHSLDQIESHAVRRMESRFPAMKHDLIVLRELLNEVDVRAERLPELEGTRWEKEWHTLERETDALRSCVTTFQQTCYWATHDV